MKGLDRPYENKGVLYGALADFKQSYCIGHTEEWPQYWREFADQAFADLMALEFLLRENGIEVPKPAKTERDG